jgi:hypothetical protein
MKAGFFKTRLMLENCDAIVTPLPAGSYIQMLDQMVAGSKFNVDVIQYQWNWYPFKPTDPLQKFNVGVLGTIRRGVKFRVLLNVEAINHRITAVNKQAERNITGAGGKVKFGPQFPITHAKLFIIDDDYVILGSHNLSSRSVTCNDETSILIKSRPVVNEYRRYFNTLWNRS